MHVKKFQKRGGEQRSAVLLAVQRCAHLPHQSQVVRCTAQRQQRGVLLQTAGALNNFKKREGEQCSAVMLAAQRALAHLPAIA